MLDAPLDVVITDDAYVLAVDVCGTLYDVNTTAGLVQHHHKRVGNYIRSFLMTIITGRRKPLGFACVLIAKITGFDLHRAISLLSLRGQSNIELDESAQNYLKVLEDHRISEVHDRVEGMKNDEWMPILVSNSVELIVKPIATNLGLPYVSSKLDWSNGRCKGWLDSDMTGRKMDYLEAFLGFSLVRERFGVITDNRSDADLINGSGAAVIVSIGRPRGWMKERDAEILYIKPK